MAEEPMSSSYADGLSPYDNKGKLGLKEIFDSKEEITKKVAQLASWIKEAKHVVFHTGAGISTSAGIPDFRGPQGVWTLEAKGLKPTVNISFNNAKPTKTHMALKHLVDKGIVKYVISQNIDGLHLRSGLPRHSMSELHGNMFTEQCSHCDRLYVRASATTSVGQRCLERSCPSLRPGGRACRGKVHDTILDWEGNLPERELNMADWHSSMADLSITLGTTLQILPSGNLPLKAKKQGGRLVICNLQPTKHDKKGDMLIRAYVDEIMEKLVDHLNCDIPEFHPDSDPTLKANSSVVEWTISTKIIKLTENLHSTFTKSLTKRKSSSPARKNEEKISPKKSKIVKNVDKSFKTLEKCESVIKNENISESNENVDFSTIDNTKSDKSTDLNEMKIINSQEPKCKTSDSAIQCNNISVANKTVVSISNLVIKSGKSTEQNELKIINSQVSKCEVSKHEIQCNNSSVSSKTVESVSNAEIKSEKSIEENEIKNTNSEVLEIQNQNTIPESNDNVEAASSDETL